MKETLELKCKWCISTLSLDASYKAKKAFEKKHRECESDAKHRAEDRARMQVRSKNVWLLEEAGFTREQADVVLDMFEAKE